MVESFSLSETIVVAGCKLIFSLFCKIEQFVQHISHKTWVEPMAIHHANAF